MLPLSLDQGMIDQIAHEFDLRAPNKEGLRQLIFHLTGTFDPTEPLVMDMATGSGKTYLMSAAVEYFRRQGMHNVMIVTPSLVVQNKTVQNFAYGSLRYVGGFPTPPEVVSPDSYEAWRGKQVGSPLEVATDPSMVFIFNVHQLVAPKKTHTSSTGTLDGQRTKIRTFQEDSGSLYEYLTELDDLIVIADESHLYGSKAKAFNQALKDLQPAATIGLTASTTDADNVIYHYPLYKAISDGYVKTPVLVYRKSGYTGKDAEERQLRDAMSLLRNKEAAYKEYRNDHPDVRQIQPALFVVCKNVEHATDTADLLRGPAYCNDTHAVLQVDNEHDNEATRRLLDNLDHEGSPIRVVVSVDKLKEGWDTKRIAVMCTLRAMASEVLTQQTMGRGLRLPFGKRTGNDRIDQLEILAHTSFEELLNDEDILQTFGLDSAVDDSTTATDILKDEAPIAGVDREGDVEVGPVAPSTATTDDAGKEPRPALEPKSAEPQPPVPTVRSLGLEDDEEIEVATPDTPIVVKINPDYAGTTFLFPSSTMQRSDSVFELKKIRNDDVKAAAKRVTDTGEVLHRKKLVVSEADKEIKTERVEDALVASDQVDKKKVAKELTSSVIKLGKLTQNKANVTQLTERIVPEFMKAADIDDWTEKAKVSALAELEQLIVDTLKAHASSLQTETTIIPIELPIDQEFSLPVGEDILDLIGDDEQSEFKVRKYYGQWAKGLFPVASFDSWSGEYLLAMMLNYSEHIQWWKRLYRHEGASIAYSTRDNYYPDFVALDTDGTYWIIEGKAESGREDETVKKKREAASDLVTELISEPKFKDSTWGYLIAYETDVRTAQSWSDLKSMAQPVVRERYDD